jgi:hypothetical protein
MSTIKDTMVQDTMVSDITEALNIAKKKLKMQEAFQEGQFSEATDKINGYVAAYSSSHIAMKIVDALCGPAQEHLPSFVDSCSLCDHKEMRELIASQQTLLQAPYVVKKNQLSVLLEVIHTYLKNTYHLRPIHELVRLVSSAPHLFQKSIEAFCVEHTYPVVSSGEVSNHLLSLSQRGYMQIGLYLKGFRDSRLAIPRLKREIYDLERQSNGLDRVSERTQPPDPIMIKIEWLLVSIDRIVRWISIGPGRDANHREACFLLNQLKSKYTDPSEGSSSGIPELCQYQLQRFQELDAMGLKISSSVYDKMSAVWIVLLDLTERQQSEEKMTDNLLTAYKKGCLCKKDISKTNEDSTCTVRSIMNTRKVFTKRRRVYVKRWFECINKIDYISDARRDAKDDWEERNALMARFISYSPTAKIGQN